MSSNFRNFMKTLGRDAKPSLPTGGTATPSTLANDSPTSVLPATQPVGAFSDDEGSHNVLRLNASPMAATAPPTGAKVQTALERSTADPESRGDAQGQQRPGSRKSRDRRTKPSPTVGVAELPSAAVESVTVADCRREDTVAVSAQCSFADFMAQARAAQLAEESLDDEDTHDAGVRRPPSASASKAMPQQQRAKVSVKRTDGMSSERREQTLVQAMDSYLSVPANELRPLTEVLVFDTCALLCGDQWAAVMDSLLQRGCTVVFPLVVLQEMSGHITGMVRSSHPSDTSNEQVRNGLRCKALRIWSERMLTKPPPSAAQCPATYYSKGTHVYQDKRHVSGSGQVGVRTNDDCILSLAVYLHNNLNDGRSCVVVTEDKVLRLKVQTHHLSAWTVAELLGK